MAKDIKIVVDLKEGVDPDAWVDAFDAFMEHRFMEDPDREIENRSFVVDSVNGFFREVNQK